MRLPQTVGIFAALALMVGLAGCGSGDAPAGRWEGFSESAHWLVTVRLQVDPGNTIHATALSVSIDGTSLARRLELTRKIKSTLLDEWSRAVVGKIDYRNETITKAGGVAPLFMFDPKSGGMTFFFYANGRLTERIKLYPVKTFASES